MLICSHSSSVFLTTPIVAMAGPAAFAVVQEHSREDTIKKQAKEIKDQAAEIQDLKRKLHQSNQELENAWDEHYELLGERNEVVHKAIKVRTRMINFQSNMQPTLSELPAAAFNAGMNVLTARISDIAPLEWEDSSEEEEESGGDQ